MGTKIILNSFQGEVPKRGRFLLNIEQASLAINCSLKSGEIRPMHEPLLVHAFSCVNEQIRYAYRMIDHKERDEDYPELWLPFTDDQVSFLKGPLVRDLWERYYWTAHNGEDNQEEKGLPIQMVSRRLGDPTDVCNTQGWRLGVPRPKMEPCVTTEILSPPLLKPHWDIGSLGWDANWGNGKFDPILGGEWAKQTVPFTTVQNRVSDNTDDWYGQHNRGGSFSGGFVSVQTYKELNTVFDQAVIGKNGWALVYDDPNPEKNGYYISGSASNDNSRFWKHCDTPPIIHAYETEDDVSTSERVSDESLNGEWREKHRTINRWTGIDAAAFVYDIATGSTTDKAQNIPVEAFDYFHGSAPSSTFPGTGTKGWFGHFWVQQDPAGHDVSDNSRKSNLIDKVFPEGESEIVTRAYVYTYVNALGEEGSPSDPRNYDAVDGENWSIYNFDIASVRNSSDYPTMVGPDGRVPITSIRVYRTITGTAGSADYFFVTEIPVLHNIPDASGIGSAARETHKFPKYYLRTNNDDGSLYNMTGVRTGDWLIARNDSSRSTADIDWVINGFYKATVRDFEGNIVHDHLSTVKWSNALTEGEYGVEWVLQPGGFLNYADFTPVSLINNLVVIDNVETSTVAYNDPLRTHAWLEAPNGLQGLVSHPNGFLAAFSGRDLFLSIPYRPHAWPEEFILTMEQPIVNIAVFNTSIVILTEGHPYVATGIRPESMTLIKHDTPIPCSSYDSVVPFPSSVLFSSREGLYMASSRGFENVTYGIMTEGEWKHHNIDQIVAARDGSTYVAFYDTDQNMVDMEAGFQISPRDNEAVFRHLRGPSGESAMSLVDNIQTDAFSGVVHILSGNAVYEFDPVHEAPIEYEWWSKAFALPDPLNFGAMSISWRRAAHTIHDAPDYTGDKLVFELFADELDPDDVPPGRSISIDIAALDGEDDPLDVPQRIIRLPAGFKSRNWWFRITGNVVVENIKLAETGKELKQA